MSDEVATTAPTPASPRESFGGGLRAGVPYAIAGGVLGILVWRGGSVVPAVGLAVVVTAGLRALG